MKKKRTPRPARCPTLVARFNNPESAIAEHTSIAALVGGWATEFHFNVLADVRDLLIIAAGEKRDAQTLAICDASGMALLNIKDRYLAKGRLGATGDELQALRLLVSVAEDFWARTSGEFFIDANRALDNYRAEERRAGCCS